MRNVIFHCHVFKNAGSTIDWALAKQFPGKFLTFDGDVPWTTLTPDTVRDYIEDHPEISAFSTHQPRLPFLDIVDTNIFGIVSLRHPIDRVASIYHYERQQPEETPGSLKARCSTFREYVEWRLRQRSGSTVLTNHQVSYFTPYDTANPQSINRRLADLDAAIESLSSFAAVCIVDRLDESLTLAEHVLSNHFSEIDLSFIKKNVMRTRSESLDQRVAKVPEKLDDEVLMNELLERNQLDQAFYDHHKELLESKINQIENFDLLVKNFRERCQSLQDNDRNEHGATIMSKSKSILSSLRKSIQPSPSPQPTGFPPGHFYSPIPNVSEIRANEDQIFTHRSKEVAGIDLAEDTQLQFLKDLSAFYDELPFKDSPEPGLRYYFENSMYSYGDAIILYGMLRHFKPSRLIEIGSGFSSAVSLDTNDLFLNHSVEFTFIEPYPERLLGLMRGADQKNCTVIESRLQDVDPEVFDILEDGDILFIDSTHVSKIDSDVNHIFFNILPRLRPGVVVHFHDISFPFEYPKKWVYEGRFWNESYMLRSFLQYNNAFDILYFNHFMFLKHLDKLRQHMPLCEKNPGGGFWMRKKGASTS